MKTLFLSVFILIFLLSNKAYSQACSTGTAYQCDLSLADNLNGFQSADILPCIVKGQFTETVVPFKVFQTLTFNNTTDSIYQMKIESVGNLPCGLCWASSSISNTFAKNQTGCLIIKGITNDVSGQYKLNVVLSFATNNSGSFNQQNKNLQNVVNNTAQIILIVLGSDDTCPAINYTGASNVAAVSCP